MADLVRLHPDDDVAVALRDLAPGTPAGYEGGTVTPQVAVPRGHKVAVREVAVGALVHRYGQVIGAATAALAPGDHVHLHNLGMPEPTSRVRPDTRRAVDPAGVAARTFAGIRRRDGRVGTRNHVAVVATVSCAAGVVRAVARRLDGDLPVGVDRVVPVTHPSGCGLQASGPGWENLRRTLVGHARHPNVGGVVVVGLGCEVLTADTLVADLGEDGVPVAVVGIQDAGGTLAAVDQGVAACRAAAARMVADREQVGLSELVLGLKCGGSDAWSGVTANPVLGYASDVVVAQGGTAVLAETPELYGAEHLLAARAADPAVADELLRRIDWWEGHTRAHGATLDANPSAGNKAGGITTIVEKSLGAVAKAGAAPLRAVVDYAAPVPRHAGLVVMDTPGYDPVSVTGMVAGGATLVVFTTGRGSVSGSSLAPTLKLSTTSELARRMAGDIDLDCGPVLAGTTTIPGLGEELLDLICATASGRASRCERLGIDEEIVPWQIGAVM